MINFKNNSKLITLSNDQFLLIKEIVCLGFVSKPQINMLYSIVRNQPTKIANYTISKLVKLHLLDFFDTNDPNNRINRIVYMMGRVGHNLLKFYDCFVRDPRGFKVNDHNYQSIEVVIQSLYASCFKPVVLGNNNSALVFDEKNIHTSNSLENEILLPTFDGNFATKKVLHPIQTSLKEALFQQKVDIARVPEVLADSILVGGVIDKRLRSELGSKFQGTFDPKMANEGLNWFDNSIEFLKKLRLPNQTSLYEHFLVQKPIEAFGSTVGLSKVEVFERGFCRGRGAENW